MADCYWLLRVGKKKKKKLRIQIRTNNNLQHRICYKSVVNLTLLQKIALPIYNYLIQQKYNIKGGWG